MMEENNKSSLSLKEKIILIILFVVVGFFLLYLVSNMEEPKKEEKDEAKEEVKEETTKVDSEIDKIYKDKNMTSENAYKLIEDKRNQSDSKDSWVVEYTSINATKEDAVLVGYTELNKDGYESELGLIMEYRDNKWTFDLPGSSGFAEDQLKDFNFIQKPEIYYAISNDIAKYLIEAKRIELGYGTWTTKTAEFVQKGINDYYLVSYVENNNTSGEQELSTIFHFNKETNKWEFTIPGASGYQEGELDKYQFKEIEK